MRSTETIITRKPVGCIEGGVTITGQVLGITRQPIETKT